MTDKKKISKEEEEELWLKTFHPEIYYSYYPKHIAKEELRKRGMTRHEQFNRYINSLPEGTYFSSRDVKEACDVGLGSWWRQKLRELVNYGYLERVTVKKEAPTYEEFMALGIYKKVRDVPLDFRY